MNCLEGDIGQDKIAVAVPSEVEAVIGSESVRRPKSVKQRSIGLYRFRRIVGALGVDPIITETDTLIGDIDDIITCRPESAVQEKLAPPVE